MAWYPGILTNRSNNGRRTLVDGQQSIPDPIFLEGASQGLLKIWMENYLKQNRSPTSESQEGPELYPRREWYAIESENNLKSWHQNLSNERSKKN